MARRIRYNSVFEGPTREALASSDAPLNIWRGPLRVQQGFLCTFSRTEDPRKEGAPQQKKVIDYKFDAVCHWGGIFGMCADASVVRGSAYMLVLMLVLFGVVGLIVRATRSADEGLSPDAAVIDAMVQRLTIIVTFVLGFFVSANVQRWWNHREYVRQLHGAVLDLLLCASSVGVSEEHLWEIARLGLLSQALLFEETRGSFDSDGVAAGTGQTSLSRAITPEPRADEATQPLALGQGLTILDDGPLPSPGPPLQRLGPFAGILRLGLVTQHEAGFLDGRRSKAQVVWVWIARYLVALHQNEELGCLDSFGLMWLQERCSHARTSISLIMTQLNTQLPFTYVQLVAMMVQFSHLVIAVCCGRAAALALQQKQYIVLAAQILQVLLIPLTFQSLLDVCVLINDPFGSDVLDFSFLQLHIMLADQCEAFLSDVPPHITNGSPQLTTSASRSNSPCMAPRRSAVVPPLEQSETTVPVPKVDQHLKVPVIRLPEGQLAGCSSA